jgi:hypothetical protein
MRLRKADRHDMPRLTEIWPMAAGDFARVPMPVVGIG